METMDEFGNKLLKDIQAENILRKNIVFNIGDWVSFKESGLAELIVKDRYNRYLAPHEIGEMLVTLLSSKYRISTNEEILKTKKHFNID